jgi:hypothetical protein
LSYTGAGIGRKRHSAYFFHFFFLTVPVLLMLNLFPLQLIETGRLPLRPGVKRLIEEAMDMGIPVAVCSTSNERAVSKIVEVMLGPKVAAKMQIFAGDVVPKKKPSPDVSAGRLPGGEFSGGGQASLHASTSYLLDTAPSV